jgi:hypothetical protein
MAVVAGKRTVLRACVTNYRSLNADVDGLLEALG